MRIPDVLTPLYQKLDLLLNSCKIRKTGLKNLVISHDLASTLTIDWPKNVRSVKFDYPRNVTTNPEYDAILAKHEESVKIKWEKIKNDLNTKYVGSYPAEIASTFIQEMETPIIAYLRHFFFTLENTREFNYAYFLAELYMASFFNVLPFNVIKCPDPHKSPNSNSTTSMMVKALHSFEPGESIQFLELFGANLTRNDKEMLNPVYNQYVVQKPFMANSEFLGLGPLMFANHACKSFNVEFQLSQPGCLYSSIARVTKSIAIEDEILLSYPEMKRMFPGGKCLCKDCVK